MDITAPPPAPLLAQLWFLLPLLLICHPVKTAWVQRRMVGGLSNLCIGYFSTSGNIACSGRDPAHPQGGTPDRSVIISRFGLFVIETKNMKGWCSATRPEKLDPADVTLKAQLPEPALHQGTAHDDPRPCWGSPDNQLHSVIFFIGDCI